MDPRLKSTGAEKSSPVQAEGEFTAKLSELKSLWKEQRRTGELTEALHKTFLRFLAMTDRPQRRWCAPAAIAQRRSDRTQVPRGRRTHVQCETESRSAFGTYSRRETL